MEAENQCNCNGVTHQWHWAAVAASLDVLCQCSAAQTSAGSSFFGGACFSQAGFTNVFSWHSSCKNPSDSFAANTSSRKEVEL
jgi:hypothetical protein